MDSWISKMESLFTDGVTDINFPMERRAALSAENSLKTDLAHRKAEMAGIGGMTDVNGQPGKMLGADATGGSAVMQPEGFGYGADALYGTGAYSLLGMSSQASPLHDAGINGATMYGSSAIITASGESVAGQVTSTSSTAVEKPKKKKNKVFGFLKDAADFLILDDVKTVFDPKASFLDKGLAVFSVTPAGKALKAGRLGLKLVQNSPVGKIVSKKVDNGTGNAKRPGGYRNGDVDEHGYLSPGVNRAPGNKNIASDNRIQSHHPIQNEWAKRWSKQGGFDYSETRAPATLLPSSSGHSHAQISSMQRKRRKVEGYDTDIRREFNVSYREMIEAGVGQKNARKVMGDAYKYFDSLGGFVK